MFQANCPESHNMEALDFTRSKALNNIPNKKLQDILSSIQNSAEDEKVKAVKLMAINRYADSNIPIEYWNLKMEKDFVGDARLKKKYDEYVLDVKNSYINGNSLCLAGSHGLGKTMATTCILKKACHKGFSCLYTTLSDVVSILTQANNEDKFLARRELIMIDFLVIDELDERFMATENAADLYARSLEGIFRTRSQNKLPTLICTNSPNIIECFTGNLKISLNSLMQGYMEFFPVFGNDIRVNK